MDQHQTVHIYVDYWHSSNLIYFLFQLFQLHSLHRQQEYLCVYDCDLDLILICVWEDSMKIFLTTNQDLGRGSDMQCIFGHLYMACLDGGAIAACGCCWYFVTFPTHPMAGSNPRFASSLYSWHSAQCSKAQWIRVSIIGAPSRLNLALNLVL